MKPLIIALDVESDKEALSLIKATKKYADIYKVGPGLVLRYGPKLFQTIRKQSRRIFLDLKFHDIPNTMMRSIKEAAKNHIFSATVHTSAGPTALKTVAKLKRRPLIWGVTVLTSLSSQDLSQIGYRHAPLKQVLRLGKMAKAGRIDGVVASVKETAALRKRVGRNFHIITPGIRMPGDDVGDQKRIATPRVARKAGSSFIVVGRPIIESRNPEKTAKMILDDWKN